jgi:SAM-dependent methyltransferase
MIDNDPELTAFYAPKWTDPEYIQGKRETFELVDQYLTEPPQRILDIGCGYAHVSGFFQKKYGTELWLLDGDRSLNTDQHTRKAKYGPVDDFQFYAPVQQLREHWDSQQMQYTFVDASAPQIDPLVKFDLIYSWISCGFHYPVTVYRDLIVRHSDERTVVIMDFRRKTLSEQQQHFTVLDTLRGSLDSKKITLHIRFN